MSFRVAGAERTVQLEVVGVLQESAADSEQDILTKTQVAEQKKKIDQMSSIDQVAKAKTYFELIGLIDHIEIGFDCQRFLQTLLEQALERHNLLDIAEESIDLGR